MVKDIDRGYADLVKRIFEFRHPRVAAGIQASEGDEAHPGLDGEDGALTLIEVAVWNEFGVDWEGVDKKGNARTVHVPPRSFIREWFDANETAMRQHFRTLMGSVVRGDRTRDQVLELIGQWAVGEIQKRIAAGIDPPNAPSTVRRKGPSTPLIATGQLRSGITYRVEERS